MSDTRNNIARVAGRLFEMYGYQQTTLHDIADKLKKSTTSIYRYFGNKEEVFAMVVENESQRFVRRLKREVKSKDIGKNKLEDYIDVRFRLTESLATRYEFIRHEYLSLYPIVERHRAKAHEQEVAFVEELLRAGHINGEYSLESAENTARILVNTIRALELQMYITCEFPNKGVAAQKLKAFLLYGAVCTQTVELQHGIIENQ